MEVGRRLCHGQVLVCVCLFAVGLVPAEEANYTRPRVARGRQTIKASQRLWPLQQNRSSEAVTLTTSDISSELTVPSVTQAPTPDFQDVGQNSSFTSAVNSKSQHDAVDSEKLSQNCTSWTRNLTNQLLKNETTDSLFNQTQTDFNIMPQPGVNESSLTVDNYDGEYESKIDNSSSPGIYYVENGTYVLNSENKKLPSEERKINKVALCTVEKTSSYNSPEVKTSIPQHRSQIHPSQTTSAAITAAEKPSNKPQDMVSEASTAVVQDTTSNPSASGYMPRTTEFDPLTNRGGPFLRKPNAYDFLMMGQIATAQRNEKQREFREGNYEASAQICALLNKKFCRLSIGGKCC